MSLSLLEVVSAVRARRASLSAETVGYLLLGVADQVIGVPREIGAHDVLLGPEGAVRVGVGTVAAPVRTECALRELLDALLSVASTATPALLRIGRRRTSAGVEALVRELEAALIPVNRAAARRALTRLYRDTQRASQAGPLDVAAAQAWLQRAMSPSAPAPAVASEPGLTAVEPVTLAIPSSSIPVEVFEASQPNSIAITRPPPLIEERPALESLTRPEPVLVRAAARARIEVRELEVEVEHEPPGWVGTPRLGTFAAVSALPAPALPAPDALLLGADEATDRMPEVIDEPAVLLVKTAPLPEVVTTPVASDELSAELASVVAEAVTEGEEPGAADGDFCLDEEIVIVVDEDLEAFEPEFLPAPISEQESAEAAAGEQCQGQAETQGEADDLATREWSSPEPPELPVSEADAPHEQAAPPMTIEPVAALELPSVPELELPPLPEFVAWPTPEPPAHVAVTAEPSSAASEALSDRDAAFELWDPEPNYEAYFEAWEPEPIDEAYFAESELEHDADAVTQAPEPERNDEADFEAAAAEYAALGPESPVEPVLVERRVLPLPDATDYSEVGWTPAPDPAEPPPALVAPEPPQPAEVEQPPEPAPELEPEPAPPRFLPRRSDVSELLRGFAVTEARSDRELCRDLKALAGVDLTPPPPRSGVLR